MLISEIFGCLSEFSSKMGTFFKSDFLLLPLLVVHNHKILYWIWFKAASGYTDSLVIGDGIQSQGTVIKYLFLLLYQASVRSLLTYFNSNVIKECHLFKSKEPRKKNTILFIKYRIWFFSLKTTLNGLIKLCILISLLLELIN